MHKNIYHSRIFSALVALAISASIPLVSTAETIPFSIRQAVVRVQCANRQGSGVVIKATPGYVLTNAHVLLNLKTGLPAAECEIGFLRNEQSNTPAIFYRAQSEHYAFDEVTNRDFAILRITEPKQVERISPLPFLKTDEFSEVGDPITILSYPQTAQGKQITSTGSINALEQGLVQTNAEIAPGSSGGPAVNPDQSIIGLATRILYQEDDQGNQELIRSDLVDIRAILTWMDTYGANAHDHYVTHADEARYHGPLSYIQFSNLQCSLLARSPLDAAVYCLRADGTRSVFPNSTTYLSWFADFSTVATLPVEQLAPYRLTTNVTLRPGTLVKIQTDPKVYIVTDIQGTLRWMTNEERAKELFGEGWAGFVKDVPVEFFQNYHIGAPLP